MEKALGMLDARTDPDSLSAETYLDAALGMLQKPECPSCSKTETCDPFSLELEELKATADRLADERQAVLDQIAGMVSEKT